MTNFISLHGKEFIFFEDDEHFERFKERVLDLEEVIIYNNSKLTGLQFLQLCGKKEINQAEKNIVIKHVGVLNITDLKLNQIWIETPRSDSEWFIEGNYDEDEDDYDDDDDYDDYDDEDEDYDDD